jgi:hypothetical protein
VIEREGKPVIMAERIAIPTRQLMIRSGWLFSSLAS